MLAVTCSTREVLHTWASYYATARDCALRGRGIPAWYAMENARLAWCLFLLLRTRDRQLRARRHEFNAGIVAAFDEMVGR